MAAAAISYFFHFRQEIAKNLNEEKRQLNYVTNIITSPVWTYHENQVRSILEHYAQRSLVSQVSFENFGLDEKICLKYGKFADLDQCLVDEETLLVSSVIFEGQTLGVIKSKISLDQIRLEGLRKLGFYLFLVIVFIFIVFAILFLDLKKEIINPLTRIIEFVLDDPVITKKKRLESLGRSLEMNRLTESINRMLDKIHLGLKEKVEIESVKGQVELARQVTHDIKSPLVALKHFLPKLKFSSENEKLTVLKSIDRIESISSDLLNKSKKRKEESEGQEQTLVFRALNDIINEKRLLTSTKKKIDISCESSTSAVTSFVLIKSSDLKRIFSNLLDNSIDAIHDKGRVTISCNDQREFVEVIIRDNGSGMSDEALESLNQKEPVKFTTKDKGNGLGVSHSKKILQEIGGRIFFSPTSEGGTQVQLTLPKTAPPPWFEDTVNLQDKDIIILDDDESILNLWKSKFEVISKTQRKLFFQTSSEFESHLGDRHDSHFFLFTDYELIDNPMNGIELIRKYGLQKQSLLITSHFDEVFIAVQCQRNSIKAYPKDLISFLKI